MANRSNTASPAHSGIPRPAAAGQVAQARPVQQAQVQAPRQAQPSPAAAPPPAGTPAYQAGQSTAPVAIPGANDPAYLAYMRQMGVDEANVNALTGWRVNSLTRQLGRALPAYAERREHAIRDTGIEHEGRGMYRSGARISGQAEAARAVDRQRMDYEAGIRDEIGELYLRTAMDVAEIRRNLVEQGLDYAAADVIARAEAGL